MATVSIRSKIVTAIALVCASVWLPACYTIVQHPRLAQLQYQRPNSTSCRTCHSSADLWRYTHPTSLPTMSGAWAEFYDMPWWYQRHWQTTPSDSSAARKDAPDASEVH